jgi:hypothetical protein
MGLLGQRKLVRTTFDNIKSLEALTVERLNEIIAEHPGRIALDFPVSFKDFEEWAADKEGIPRY